MVLSQSHRLCLHLLTRGVSRLVGANDGLVGANDGLVRGNDGLLGPNNNLISAEFVMPYYNVSSTNSEQSKLCINGPLYIDAWLLWEQAIGSNGT